MQNFTIHSHTNSYGIFDGSNSIEEMIQAAETKGFKEYGISNHLICYPDYLIYPMPIHFRSFAAAGDIYKRVIDDVRTKAAKSKMKVRVGFEVNFFVSSTWRKEFEKAIKQLDVDYLIGANHDLFDNNFQKACSLYDVADKTVKLTPEEQTDWLHNHWKAGIEMVKSGYFDFIAHLDLVKRAHIPEDTLAKDLKQKMLAAIIDSKQPIELNTSNYNKTGEPSPSEDIFRELGKHKIPVLISCDSHSAAAIGQHFEKAEAVLAQTGCTTRWRLPSKARIR